MKSTLAKVERLTDSVSLFAANMAAIVLLVLVALTCVDVVGRYFFNSPLVGTVELVRLCMGAITFLSFPLMFSRNDHIIVDLIPHFRRGYLGWITSILILVVTAYISLKLGNRVFDYATRAFEDGDVTEYLDIPRYPFVGFITAMIFTAGAVSILKLLSVIVNPGHGVEEVVEINLLSTAKNSETAKDNDAL